MAMPKTPQEAGFDKEELRIAEKDIPEIRIRSSLSKFTTGSDGLLIAVLLVILGATFLLARLLPSVSNYLSTLQTAFSLGR